MNLRLFFLPFLFSWITSTVFANDPYLPEGWTPNWVQNQPGNLDRQGWTRHLFKETLRFSSQILQGTPRDIEDYCPNWKNLDLENRRAFLTVFITAIAKWESNFNPQDFYKEGRNDSTGRPVISRGLLQLSVQSARSYGCDVDEVTLHDPRLNLSCGVSILNKWVQLDNYLGSSVPLGNGQLGHYGGGRYWSVLRNAHLSRGRIITYLKTQNLCWPRDP
jgi:hypothetical protein